MKLSEFVKKIFCLSSAFIFSAIAFAVEVDTSELLSVENTIVFENYTGPHSVVDSLDDIKGIGTNLADNFIKDADGTYGNTEKYYVIHCVDETNDELLDADIFIIGENAQVDHIRNLRHIISSYLTKAYGYEYDDAYTIATFVTVYNAVYRKNIDYFTSKYKEAVTKNLTPEKAGISVSYKEWAAQTQIVIPLADLNGGLSTIDTSVISDKNVVSSMQEEDDMGIDERKNMVEIKEREADTAEEKAKEAQKEARRDEDELKQDRKELEESQKETSVKEKKAEESQKKADELSKKAAENPDDKKLQKEAQDAKKQAEKDKKEALDSKAKTEEKKKKVEEKSKKVEKSKTEAQKQQTKADKKQTEAITERKEIAKDQKEVINKKEAEKDTSVYALKLVDEKEMFCAIVKLNKNDGKELKTSQVKVIRNRTVCSTEKGFIAIAGINAGKGAVKLVLIDKDTLEMTAETEEKIAEQSVLVPSDKDFICVIDEGGHFYPAKFDSSLKCVSRSAVEVKPATPVYLCEDGIYVTNKSGKIEKAF